jgi:hypothetical protein
MPGVPALLKMSFEKCQREEERPVILLKSTIPRQGIVCARSRIMRFTRSNSMDWAKTYRKSSANRAGFGRSKRVAAMGITASRPKFRLNKKEENVKSSPLKFL